MPKKFYVYNETRQSFLSLGVSVADTHLTSLKGLLGKTKLRGDDGIWMVPSQGIHTIGVLVPIDVIYLDADRKVIHLVEHLAPFRIGPILISCESVLELPARTIYTSQTQIGDSVSISSREENEDPPEAGTAALSWAKGNKYGRWLLHHIRRWLKSWLASLTDRRAYERMSLPVVAHYWTGGAPVGYRVTGISPGGGYIVTPDRWYPGTILQLTIEYDNGNVPGMPMAGNSKTAATVRAKVVRRGPDGVGVSIVYLSEEERRNFARFLAGVRAQGKAQGK